MDNSGSSASAPTDLDIQAQISKLTEMLNARYAKLGEAEKKLEYERASFEKAHKMISSYQDPIKLNVGGKIFMTSKSTLLNQDSMLHAMFSGRHTIQKGEDGAYFIDRDPKYFRQILNYLRDGELEAYKDEIEKNEILREAEYYCMTGLIELLSKGSSRVPEPVQEDLSKTGFDPIRKGAFVVVNGNIARLAGEFWESALIDHLTKGVHSCTFKYKKGGRGVFGISSANISYNGGAHTQGLAMMMASGPIYDLYIAGKLTKNFGVNENNFENTSDNDEITVEVDCDNRTVTWMFDGKKFTEPMHAYVKPPLSFCVDLYCSGVVITDRTSGGKKIATLQHFTK